MIFSQSASEWVFFVSIRRSNLCIKGLCCLSFRMMVGPGAGWLGWGLCLGCCRIDACVPWYVPVVDAVPSVSLEDSCVGGIAVLTESSGGGRF